MVEETVILIEKNKGTSKDQFAKVVLGAIAGYAAGKLVEFTYDKLIVEGRLKALIRRK